MEITLTSKKQAWLHAVRLRTLPLALSSILMGSILAADQGGFRFEVFILAAITTIFLQILSNLSNDYGDSIHGADNPERQGPIRAVQSGVISLASMKKAMILFAFLSLGSGLGLLYISLNDWLLYFIFLGLGVLAIIAAITYTSGAKPYGYAGLGDLSVFIFFGLLGVSGTYFLHTLSFNWLNIFPAISLGLFSTAVLNINNIRDIESDTKAGKKSIPVRIGKTASLIYNWSLLLGGNGSIVIFASLESSWWPLSSLLALPMMIKVGLGVSNGENSSMIDPFLKKMAISTLLWVFFFGLGWIIFN